MGYVQIKIAEIASRDDMYLTTLCEDCIKDIDAHELLINEKHLMVEVHKSKQ